MPRPPSRIFIGLREIAGVGRGLKAGFDRIGADSLFLDLGFHPFSYPPIEGPLWARVLSRLSSFVGRFFVGNWFARILWVGGFQNLFAAPAFLLALFRYDTFIFLSASSFFLFLELPILRLFRKKVIFVFLGSDSRPAFINGYVAQGRTGARDLRRLRLFAKLQKAVIRIVEAFATEIVNIPPQSHFHERTIINGMIMGLPTGVSAPGVFPGVAVLRTSAEPPRILHSPSQPGPKGTARIRDMISRLREKGLRFEYREVIRRPHTEVLEELRRCDFIIDELYSDTPMAGLAAEAAAFGRPAVVGSYYATELRDSLPPELTPPGIFCLPEEVEAAVARLISDPEYRSELGRAAEEFSRTRWSAPEVAKRYLQLIDGTAPVEWRFDPGSLRYVEGCGQSRETGLCVLRDYVKNYGVAALLLSDKPELEKSFSKLAGAQ